MPVEFKMGHPVLRAWALYHQTYNLLYKCEEVMFSKVGLTPQKYMVLMAIRLIEDAATVSDVAQWLDRNTNSISLIVDRMKKEGLITRSRSLGDRRTVRLSLTQKGQEKLDQASVPGWDLVQEMISPLSEKELNTFADLLEPIRKKAFEYLNPGKTMKEVRINDIEKVAQFFKRTGRSSQ
jgi:MarR family transcriptional regulator, organic hydroperoxide resistance regulator